MFFIVFGVILGFLYANFLEWFVHKNFFHGLGSRRDSVFAHHFHQHHRKVNMTGGLDSGYLQVKLSPEKIWLVLLNVIHLPLLYFWPAMGITLAVMTAVYYFMHRKSHTSVEWGKRWIPWHVQHHLGTPKERGGNWCVTTPLFDYVMGTRINTTKFM